ncbi:fibronectin type III-like domain-contianing protein [Streptomyces beijiangensis]|uniref:fibronectin type III-like domain-contianing protein n=1 Tax=Streptomyces beijiangensis TaxID=163361 RepID=UPI0027DE4BBF|nr:fibronectin type III-like domain-contianing protein [Streptomyces beijiangensis]
MTAVVNVPARAVRHWSTDAHGWRTETGVYQVHAGRSAADLPLTAAVDIGERP